MKKIINIIFYLICFIIALLSFAMMFIELRLLISGDFIIYDNVFNGFIRYFFRFLLSCLFVFMVLCESIGKIKKNDFIKNNLLVFEMSMLIASVIIFLTTTNYINIIVLLLMIMFIALKILKMNIK